jgi:DNA-binding response OmpR family regulator
MNKLWGIQDVAVILIVDDDQQLVTQIAAKLTATGHTCVTASNGERALEVLSTKPVDLLILDVMIPGISGFEVCRRVHSNMDLYTTPILFISAMNSEEEIAHGLAQGADDYLAKPFRLDVLMTRIHRLLETNANNNLSDELTSLAGAKHIKLEIQRATNLKHHFAAIYVELLRINELGRALGHDARAKTIRHLARGLHQCGSEFSSEVFNAGHMGGGHFICLIEPNHAMDYCRLVKKLWDKHLPALQETLGLSHPEGGASAKGGLHLELLFCIAVHESSSHKPTQDLFDTLTHLRQKALSDGESGIHIDRRHQLL